MRGELLLCSVEGVVELGFFVEREEEGEREQSGVRVGVAGRAFGGVFGEGFGLGECGVAAVGEGGEDFGLDGWALLLELEIAEALGER